MGLGRRVDGGHRVPFGGMATGECTVRVAVREEASEPNFAAIVDSTNVDRGAAKGLEFRSRTELVLFPARGGEESDPSLVNHSKVLS